MDVEQIWDMGLDLGIYDGLWDLEYGKLDGAGISDQVVRTYL